MILSSSFRTILDSIQQHVVERYGYGHVNALRTAVARFPDDPVVNEAFYGKENRASKGYLTD